MPKPKPIVFISHIAEEVDLAVMFKKHIEDDFLDLVDVFVSSDSESISPGADWRIRVETALRQACIQLILCSQASVTRPWINFEAGAVWLRKAPVVPICHTGFEKAKLPSTLGHLQAVEANERGLDQVYGMIARELPVKKPQAGLKAFASEIQAFEASYQTTLGQLTNDQSNQEESKIARMKNYLEERKNRPRPWRTIRRIANRNAIAEAEALELLRRDADVEFKTDNEGVRWAKIKSRVGLRQSTV